MALEAFQRQCKERVTKSNAIYAAEIEENKKKEEKERLRLVKLTELREKQRIQRCEEVDHIENSYIEQISGCNPDTSSTSPLLLDEVVTPLYESTCSCSLMDMAGRVCCKEQLKVARQDRDSALMLARQYRDLAEASHTKIRQQKNELEEKVELVREFWRNKIVEGSSRSGQILRAAEIIKY